METNVLECGHTPTPTTGGGTGYGIYKGNSLVGRSYLLDATVRDPQGVYDKDEVRLCYACCADSDRANMIETGKAVLYLTIRVTPEEHKAGFRRWYVTNWPGSLSFLVGGAIRYGKHNIAGTRKDVWFTGPDGREWHGVQYGEWTQICHCHRLAKQSKKYAPPSAPVPLPSALVRYRQGLTDTGQGHLLGDD